MVGDLSLARPKSGWVSMPPLAIASVRPSASSSSSCGPMPCVGNSPMRAKAVARVVDADHAGGVVEIVLGGVEQRAVRREDAVAEEMPAGDALRSSAAASRPAWSKTTAKVPGWRAKTTERPRDRIEGDVVAAVGQLDRVQDLAGLGQDRRAIGAVAPLVGGGEDRVGRKRVGAGRQAPAPTGSRAGGLEEIAAVDQRRACRMISLRRATRSRRSGRARRTVWCRTVRTGWR